MLHRNANGVCGLEHRSAHCPLSPEDEQADEPKFGMLLVLSLGLALGDFKVSVIQHVPVL